VILFPTASFEIPSVRTIVGSCFPGIRVSHERLFTCQHNQSKSKSISRFQSSRSGQDDKVIDNSSVRFAKRVTVPAIPKPGALLQLTTSADMPFECRVTRADWSDQRSLFIVSCSYSSRSIPQEVYAALITDSDWQMRQLL
jgi:hypothetical protein